MKTNEVYTKLVNEGPQTTEELGRSSFTPQVKRDGVRKFAVKRGGKGTIESGGGVTTNVYYIEGKHEAKSIVKKWLDENRDIVEKSSEWSVHQRISSHGEEFRTASRELLGPFDIHTNLDQERTGTTKMKACPMCGEELNRSLAEHLPCQS